MRNLYISVCLLVALSITPLNSQKSAPETPGKMEIAQHPLQLDPPVGPQPQKLDPVKLRQQADEISSLAQSLPADIAQITQGKLPKGMEDKLKRIEKLSKHLRSELAP
ncbi:MAG: hypothetical protein WAL89_09605 [Candidatus Sulfotelmatobacter sp.]